MPILREYRCRDCGTTFESFDADPECPTCIGEPERVFLTPPAIKSPKTATKDEIVRSLANDYGLSDISNKNGEPVKKAPADSAAQFANPNIAQALARVPGGRQDNFSNVLPAFANKGPRTWAKRPERQ